VIKTLLALLSLVSICETHAQRGGRDSLLVQGTALAREAESHLENAIRMLSDISYREPSNQMIKNMLRKASVAEIWDASGHRYCRSSNITGSATPPAMLAEQNGKKIYVCPGFMTTPCDHPRGCQVSRRQRIYILLHEIGHLTGLGGSVADECKADDGAREVLWKAGIPQEPGHYDEICSEHRRNR